MHLTIVDMSMYFQMIEHLLLSKTMVQYGHGENRTMVVPMHLAAVDMSKYFILLVHLLLSKTTVPLQHGEIWIMVAVIVEVVVVVPIPNIHANLVVVVMSILVMSIYFLLIAHLLLSKPTDRSQYGAFTNMVDVEPISLRLCTNVYHQI